MANPQADPLDELERATRRGYIALFAAVFRARTSGEWLSILGEHDIPAAEVLDLGQALDSEQVRANRLVQSLHQPGIGPVRVLGNLFKLDGRVPAARCPAPLLGEHDDEVLGPLRTPAVPGAPQRPRRAPASQAPAPARDPGPAGRPQC